MARNGSGVYNLLTNSWNPANNGVSATAVDWQNLINDVASALTQSLSADGQTPVTGNLAMSNNKLTGLAAGTGAGQSIRWEQVFTAPASFGGGAINVDASGNVGIGAFNVNTSGNVGIGTSSPGNALVVSRGAGVAAYIQSISGTNNSVFGNGAGGELVTGSFSNQPYLFFTNSAERMRIDQSGNVGIGTSSPGAKLNVIGDIQLSRSATASDAALNFGSNSNTYIYGGNSSNIIAFATNGAERMRIEANGQQSSVIPGGTVLYPEFKCRAWVNFNGTGTVAIRASGNVSSITDNGIGQYTVNFTTAMPDANYVVIGMGMINRRVQYQSATFGSGIQTTSATQILNTDSGTTAQDDQCINIAVFR